MIRGGAARQARRCHQNSRMPLNRRLMPRAVGDSRYRPQCGGCVRIYGSASRASLRHRAGGRYGQFESRSKGWRGSSRETSLRLAEAAGAVSSLAARLASLSLRMWLFRSERVSRGDWLGRRFRVSMCSRSALLDWEGDHCTAAQRSQFYQGVQVNDRKPAAGLPMSVPRGGFGCPDATGLDRQVWARCGHSRRALLPHSKNDCVCLGFPVSVDCVIAPKRPFFCPAEAFFENMVIGWAAPRAILAWGLFPVPHSRRCLGCRRSGCR